MGQDRRTAIGPDLMITRRDLPHWQVGGSTYFITFRLKGTLGPGHCGGAGFQPALAPKERQIVKESILHWHGSRWTVHALTVMPDHVHILATPCEKTDGQWFSLSQILQSVKRYSARGINELCGRRGAVWMTESFDRIMRDEKEFDEKANYILSNAVRAELVEDGWLYDGFWCEGAQSARPDAG